MIIAAFFSAIIFLCLYIHSALPAAYAAAAAYALSLLAAACLMCGNAPFEFKCAWLTFIIAVPVCGAVCYLLFSVRGDRRPRPPRLPAASCTKLEYFSDGEEYLTRLKKEIAAAKKSVFMEYYIFSKGRIWRGVCGELENCLARGVEVKILYDAFGSVLNAPKRDFTKLRRAGAEVKAFGRLAPLPQKLNVRDHRKLTVIDGELCFLGGVNIADEYAHVTSPYAFWKDGGVMLRGGVAEVFADLFLYTFTDGEHRVNDGHTQTFGDNALPIADVPDGDCVFENELSAAIFSAHKRVYVFTPYLCMGEKLLSALRHAVSVGADVKIIIPAVPDKKFTYAITRAFAEKLTLFGVKVYEYTPGFMHFKGVVADERAYVGSYNFDFRSMRLNLENGIFLGSELADPVAEDFLRSIALSRPFTAGRVCKFKRELLCLLSPLV